MTLLAFILCAQFSGIIGHWLTRWAQGRTGSSFKEYMMGNKAQTLQSVFASLSSGFAVYASVPEGIAGKALVMVLIGTYMAGYTFDSKLNRDPNGYDSHPVPQPTSLVKEPDHATTKPLSDIIADDSNL